MYKNKIILYIVWYLVAFAVIWIWKTSGQLAAGVFGILFIILATTLLLDTLVDRNRKWEYAGGYFESSIGLVKFGTRYYNSQLGRWTQQEPVGGSLGKPDTLNRYLYVSDGPVNQADPSGKDWWACFWFGFDAFFFPFIIVLGGVWGLFQAWEYGVFAIFVALGAAVYAGIQFGRTLYGEWVECWDIS